MRNSLPYKVECRPRGQGWWETIAAFNCEIAAQCYAHECATANGDIKYRVAKGSKILASNELGAWPKAFGVHA